MTPSSWVTIVAFFGLVAPGLWFDILSARKRIKATESTFAEISRVALVSTLCTAATFGLFAGFQRFSDWLGWPRALPVPSALIEHDNSEYLSGQVTTILVSAAMFVGIAMALAGIAFKVIYRKAESSITYTSGWNLMLREDAGDADVLVCARMKDGSAWYGVVADHSPDGSVDERELILCGDIAYQPKGASTPMDLSDAWQRALIQGADIESLLVMYEKTDETMAPEQDEGSNDQSSAPAGGPAPAGAAT